MSPGPIVSPLWTGTMVTAFDSDHAETRFAQSGNHLFACESRQLGH